MTATILMPLVCPDCQKALYGTSGSRPAPSGPRLATLLYVVAGTVTALTYLVGLVVLREWLKQPIGPVLGDEEVVLYHVPPTWLLSLVALPVALVPGFAVGWFAARLPNVRRLRCWNCRWSATFPAGAVWADPPPERSSNTPSSAAAFEVVADDVDPWKECAAWAYAEIRRGHSPKTSRPMSSRKAGPRMMWPGWSNSAVKTRGNGVGSQQGAGRHGQKGWGQVDRYEF